VYSQLSKFENDNSKFLLLIFEEFLKIDTYPNPLSDQLSEGGNSFIDDILDKMESSSKGVLYAQLLKMCTLKPEIHQWILRTDVIKKLSENLSHSDPQIAIDSLEILEQVLVSEDHQEIISKYVSCNYDAVMEVLHSFKSKQLKLIKSAEIAGIQPTFINFTPTWVGIKEGLFYLKYFDWRLIFLK